MTRRSEGEEEGKSVYPYNSLITKLVGNSTSGFKPSAYLAGFLRLRCKYSPLGTYIDKSILANTDWAKSLVFSFVA